MLVYSKIFRCLYLLLLFTGFVYNLSVAQSLPVGTPVLEEAMRRSQLLGKLDSNVSFTVRPLNSLTQEADIFDPDSSLKRNSWTYFRQPEKSNIKFKVLPFSVLQQYDTNHPHGINDGAMIPSAGYQTMISGGLFGMYGPLSIQLRPEFVYSQNKNYEGFNDQHYDITWARYYHYYLNYIDQPERFGWGNYSKAYWGQSNISLNYKGIRASLSSENLWWGPGIRNSLLMSNNAPGFKHISLGTSQAFITPAGSFEAQFISGQLENSGYPPPEPNRIYNGQNLYIPMRDEDRYISGFVLTYQPKWIPGLFLGVDRIYQMYRNDMKKNFTDYIPVISAFSKLGTNDGMNRDQMAAFFARWVMKEAKGEIYFEYGINDYGYIQDPYLLEKKSSRAYTFGVQKLIPFKAGSDEYIAVLFELTQLEQKAREAMPWYLDGYIRQGYTNQGQIMGAGIGPGSNQQTLELSWVKGLKKLGVTIERYGHNNDFLYYAYSDIKDFRRNWVDLALTVQGNWNYKNLIFNAGFKSIHSLNYQWYFVDNPKDYGDSGTDIYSYQFQLGLSYRF